MISRKKQLELEQLREYHLNQSRNISTEIKSGLEDCPHKKLTHCQDYWEGSFDDLARTYHWDSCDRCGKRLNETVETHSWYG